MNTDTTDFHRFSGIVQDWGNTFGGDEHYCHSKILQSLYKFKGGQFLEIADFSGCEL